MSNYDERDTKRHEKKRIKDAFDLFDQENKGTISRDDVGTVLRYLGAYPSEEELMSDILPQLIRDGDALHISYAPFEKLMLHIFAEQLYEPDSEEVLLQAYRALDPEGKNYVEEDVMREVLMEGEYGFNEKEIESFLAIAKDPQTGLIHYEDYITYVINQRD